MKPILVDLGGVHVTSYGVSRALAAVTAAVILRREFKERGRSPSDAYLVVVWAFVVGLIAAKLYYLLEHAGTASAHDLGGYGFTWYGGLVGGAAAAIVVARRQGIAAMSIAAMAAAPLAVAYGIARIGCLLAGDGTYGTPSSLPWAMSFPHGTVPTMQRVHPTPLYEAIAAFAFGFLLWRLRHRLTESALFALYAVLTGVARFLVEFIRINDKVLFGLSGAQLWSAALVAFGVALFYRAARSERGLVHRPAPQPT